jgi:hypothetical protein
VTLISGIVGSPIDSSKAESSSQKLLISLTLHLPQSKDRVSVRARNIVQLWPVVSNRARVVHSSPPPHRCLRGKETSKNDSKELPLRHPVFVNLGSQYGTFPGIEQKGCQRCRIKIGIDGAFRLSFADATLKSSRPRREDHGEAIAHQPAMVGEFSAEIPDHASFGVLPNFHKIGERFEIALQAFQWRDALITQDP